MEKTWRKMQQVILLCFFAVVVFCAIAPFIFTLNISFEKNPTTSISFPPKLIPSEPSLVNYEYVLKETLFGRWAWNTFVVSSFSTVSTLIFCSMAGYLFAKYNFPGKNILFMLLLTSMMVPTAVTLVPLFKIVQALNWYNSYAALIAPNLASAFAIFLMRQACREIPSEIIQAANIDGSGLIRTYLFIALPLIRPSLATLFILTFWQQWNNFIWPLIAVGSEEMKVLTVGLASFKNQSSSNWSHIMAGASLMILPIVILYLFFQRHFVQGIAGGSLKG